MHCLLPLVFDARFGAVPADVRMVEAPRWMGAGAPRALGKGVYGENRAFHIEGGNFTVQWDDSSIDPARADEVLVHLESAWINLVEEGGWPKPSSADTWLLWVVLDSTLAGSGYTAEYTDDTYPGGYPVMWLNPVYEADNPNFGLSVAVHEFGHALQYAVRTPSDSSDAWYWEATSEWTAEHAASNLDTYAESAHWYAVYPHASWSARDRYHPYGMFLLNAWLDERVFGFEGIRDIWVGGDGVPWEERIPAVSGLGLDEIIPEMAAEIVAGTLRESALYEEPVRTAREDTWQELPQAAAYGTTFVDVDGPIAFEGPVEVRYVAGSEVLTEAPEGPHTVAFTPVSEGGFAFGQRSEDGADGCACGSTSRGPIPLLLLLLLPLRRSVV